MEEASDILCAFNFLPEEFGRFKLKKKRAVIEYIEPSEKYLERRKGTVADILMPEASTFTNKIECDTSLIYKGRLEKPVYTIDFGNKKFTVWDQGVVTQFNGEKVRNVAMRPYLDEVFLAEKRDLIIQIFDTRGFRFRNLITQKEFKKWLELLRPRK